MGKKQKVTYRCQSCGYRSGKWLGRCPRCDAYDVFEEERVSTASAPRVQVETMRLEEANPPERWLSGVEEWDRVLGGGIVPGGTYLVGGEPGIGKSTLMLQVLERYITQGLKGLYIAGEESPDQIARRVRRLGLDLGRLEVTTITDIDGIVAVIEDRQPDLVVVDSVQMITASDTPYRTGSPALLRTVAHRLIQVAKQRGTAVVFIGHVTKEGQLAGPRMLEHMVDGVFYFEGDRQMALRMIRAVKHRFGPADEVGLFEMTDRGLVPVANPATRWLDFDRESARVGGILCPVMEGIRCLVLEIQALAAPTVYAMGRRTSLGLDVGRVHTVCALLERHLGIPLSRYDVYVKISAGFRTNDPGIDLALAVALFSSFENHPIPMTWAAFGELALTGRTRPVGFIERRIQTLKRLGMTSVIVPGVTKADEGEVNVVTLDELKQLRDVLKSFHP